MRNNIKIIVDKPMKWVSTTGGPVVVMSESNAKFWQGNDNWSVFSGHGSYFDSEQDKTDYERTWAINDYVGIIPGKSGNIIVLEGPDETTWLDIPDIGGVLLCWGGADSDDHILTGLKNLREDQYEESGIVFEVTEKKHILFDSVCPGGDEEVKNNSIAFNLEKGKYGVKYFYFDSESLMFTSIMLHKI